MKSLVRKKIFEILKEIRNMKHNGLLIVFSDLNKIIAKGAIPIGQKELNFRKVCHISSQKLPIILTEVGEDGAVLIDDKGYVYSPSVYLNVSVFNIDKDQIHPEFCARHISALSTSSATNAYVYTLSEETNKIREFKKGKIKRQFPELDDEEKQIALMIELEEKREKFKDHLVKIDT